jgi:orotate phosphoribosyltransferase
MQSGKKSIIYVDATTVSFCISILKDIQQVMPEFDKNFHL